MRVARLYDGVTPDGFPLIAPDRPRIDDAAERTRVVRFLEGGAFVRGTTWRDADRLDPTRGDVVPVVTLTDGEWVWNLGLAYYVAEHGISPEPAFLEHMAEHDFRCPQPEPSRVGEALAMLDARRRTPGG